MIFVPLAAGGPVLVRPERHADARGWFARTVCAEEFARAGLPTRFPQQNGSMSVRRGTLRGLHWQAPPRAEGKLVRCVRGMAFDVAVDIRPGSPRFGRWVAATLSHATGEALWIPPGFAHGFQTLCDDTELLYLMTEPHEPALARGVRWDDPSIAVDWPLADPILSARDRALPLLGAG